MAVLLQLIGLLGVASCTGADGAEGTGPISVQQSEAAGRPASGESASSEPDESPFDAELRSTLGAGLPEIYSAVLLKQRDVYRACMAAGGWEVSEADLDAMYRHDPDETLGTTQAARFEADLERLESAAAGETPTSGPSAPAGAPPAPAELAAIASCQDKAFQDVPNPNDDLIAALDQLQVDSANRARADPAFVAAGRELNACVKTVGYDFQGNAYDHLFTLISEAAVDASLVPKLRSQFNAIRTCLDTYDAAWAAASDRAEKQIIAENPAAIAAAVSAQKRSVEELRPQLDEIQSS